MKTVVTGLFIFLLVVACLFPLENRSTHSCSGTDAENEASILEESRLRADEKWWCSETNEREVGIAKHRISVSDLERIRKEIGISEVGENYNQIIDGHGTGWRPPTEEEWTQMMDDGYIVEKIPSDITLGTASFVDHTAKQWFPPIGDQDGEGSCTCWAVGYYMKTFQEAKEHDWDLSGATWSGGQPSVKYQDRIISPDFIYHLINHGADQGSSPWTAINLICSVGASSWEKMPYNPSDSASWPSEEAWREAPLYRGDSSGWQYLSFGTDDGLASLKNWIASDNLADISVDAGKYSQLTSNDVWTLNNYVNPSTNHANAIVGYDDSLAYVENGQTRYGAFKVVNSWGVGGWEHVPDGCYWISYEAMKQRVGYCNLYYDRNAYEPELVASFRITHSKRGECRIAVGVGSQTKNFSRYIIGGGQPFCSNNIFFDITEFREAIPNMYGQQFFLEVYDGDTSATGTITKFAIEYATSTNPPISTINGGSVYAYVAPFPLGTNWRTERQVNSDNDFIDSKVSMATDSNGYLYTAYDDRNEGSDRQSIILTRSIDGGRTWFFYCSWSSSSYDCLNPSMAIDPYDGTIYVAYEIERTASDHDIYCGIITPTSMVTIGVDTDTGDDRYPSMTSEYQYGGANWQYISYEYIHDYNDRDLMFAKSTNNGVSWSIRKLHGDFPDYNVYAQTSITNAEGYIYIAYKWGADYESPCEIRVDRSTDFGSTWAQFADVDGSTNGCSFPSIAATHGGSAVLVAFQYDWSASDIDIRYSYSTNKGTNWVKGISLFASGLEDEKLPTLTVDGGGSTGNDVRGYFHIACKVGSYVKYRRAHYSVPYSWNSPVIVSERWIGKSIAIAAQYRSATAEFQTYVSWNDERTNNIYCSTACASDVCVEAAYKKPQSTDSWSVVSDSSSFSGLVMRATASSTSGGFLFGPYIRDGWDEASMLGKSYVATFRLKVSSKALSGNVAYIDVACNCGYTLQSTMIETGDFASANVWQDFNLTFVVPSSLTYGLEFRVGNYNNGIADIYVDGIEVSAA